MGNGFKNPGNVVEEGIEVVITDGDIVGGGEQNLNGEVGVNVADPAGHENVFAHLIIVLNQ